MVNGSQHFLGASMYIKYIYTYPFHAQINTTLFKIFPMSLYFSQGIKNMIWTIFITHIVDIWFCDKFFFVTSASTV